MAKFVLCTHYGKGHLIPTLALAKKLHSFQVQVCIVCAFKCTPIVETGLDFKFLEDRDHDIDSTPVISGTLPVSSISSCFNANELHPTKFKSFLEGIIQTGQKVVVLSDHLVIWSWSPAISLEVPIYSFYTPSVSNLAISFYVKGLNDSGMERSNGSPVSGVPEIPSDEIKWRLDILHPSSPLYKTKLALDNHILHADGIILNSSYAIEGKVIQALERGEVSEAKPLANKLFPVGPLLPTTSSKTIISSDNRDVYMDWLDNQPPRSVLFVSLGSWEKLEIHQVDEIAAGLEASGVRFLWIFSPGQTVLPTDFLERTGNRALAIPGWAPQNLILAHPSVGAFFSHCGWNSAIECMSLGGVPILACPLTVDQPATSRLVVKELEIGVEVGADAKGVVTRDEVESKVRLVMTGDQAKSIRDRAVALKDSIQKESVESDQRLRSFVDMVKHRLTN